MFKSIADVLAARGQASLLPGTGVLAVAASLFSTAAGRWIGIALIGAGLYVAGDLHRARLEQARFAAKWAAAVHQAEASRAARDAEVRRQVAADAERRIGEIRRESDQLQTRIEDYERTLSARNAVACRATADDARRLRDLGYAGPGPGGRAGGVRTPPAAGSAAADPGR